MALSAKIQLEILEEQLIWYRDEFKGKNVADMSLEKVIASVSKDCEAEDESIEDSIAAILDEDNGEPTTI